MKKTVFKQLLLLAVFLFAGIGSAFGQDETEFNVTINRVDASTGSVYPEDFSKVRLVFLDEDGSGYYFNTGFKIPGGKNYKLYVENGNTDMYTVTSIEINGTTYENPGQYVNEEKYIEIENLSSDITATLTIAKAPTKIVRVYRDPALADIYLYYDGNNGYWYGVNSINSDNEKIEYEVLEGSSCPLEINLKKPLTYAITKIIVGDKDVTEESNWSWYVMIPPVNDDIDVYVEVSKIGETKTISLSMEPNGDYGWEHGSVRFFDPSRHEEAYYYNDANAELLVGSTTQMIIETDLGWKVKTLKIDGTDVTETYNSQGYYEFKNLNADHSVAIELGTAEIYTITVDRDRIPDDISLWAYFDNRGSVEFGKANEFNEGSFVTLIVPAIVWNEDNKQFMTKILDNDAEITPDCPDEWNYYYTISNLSSNHVISLDYEIMPSVTVNCVYNDEDYNEYLSYSLNDVNNGLGWPCQFAKGTDVTFSLKWIPDGKVVESIKIDDKDITSDFNGSYVINNLTEDHVITIILSDAEASYNFYASFDESSSGTTYLKQAMTDKVQTNSMEFAKGSVATLFVKAPVGREVSKIHLIMYEVLDDNGNVVSDQREEDAEIRYNSDTKEYSCDVTVTSRIRAIITTQKKPSDGTTEIAYSLDASGMATFCSEYDLDFSTEATKDIAAYVAIGYNSETKKVTMLRVTEVQSGTGLLIVGKPGSYTIPVKATSRNYNNMLKAVGEDTTVPYSENIGVRCDNYVLSGSVFAKANGTPISAYQAYLQLPRLMAHTPESVSLEFIDMGDMNGDAKITITDAVMIVDKILNEQ